ncbi:hypothetical protein [Aporhodopirellula aestuarii]|uniref:Uncharacterized protein n=1 Tax=Aporhodopirellula aestuarii TaxID=2950107 RepID=A0ABT0UBL7_9BACT|nr:hypothetical protein [Aporhodopirellula aestuarii]MCM2373900.1 hypothetical protein [Aporhodopirellula aestuarii]
MNEQTDEQAQTNEKGILGSARDLLDVAADVAIDAATTLGTNSIEGVVAVSEHVQSTLANVANQGRELKDAAVQSAADTVEQVTDSVSQTACDASDAVTEAVSDAASGAIDSASDALGSLGDLL